MRRWFKAWFFKLIRPFVVKDVDSNEDYECMFCGEPVLRRFLYCSDECSQLMMEQLKRLPSERPPRS